MFAPINQPHHGIITEQASAITLHNAARETNNGEAKTKRTCLADERCPADVIRRVIA